MNPNNEQPSQLESLVKFGHIVQLANRYESAARAMDDVLKAAQVDAKPVDDGNIFGLLDHPKAVAPKVEDKTPAQNTNADKDKPKSQPTQPTKEVPKQEPPKQSTGNPDDNMQAVRALSGYYEAISSHNMQAAYDRLSSNMQKHMGSYDTFASGYQTTLSSSATEFHVVSSSKDKAVLSYNLESHDRMDNGRVKVQNFNGTAMMQQQNGTWKIVDMKVKKAGEHVQ